jgi:hypothetical protein
MYKIIGSDQKEYGPVSAEQIHEWFRDGRLNGQTMGCAEGTQEWKPLGTFPEFSFMNAPAGGAASSSNPGFGSGPLPSEEEILARDYSIDIGDRITRSWELVRANFWPVVGITFLNSLCVSGISQIFGIFSRPAMDAMIRTHEVSASGLALMFLTSLVSMPFTMALMGGLFRYYLKLIRGQNPTIGDAFSGFSNGFGKLALLGLVQGSLVWIAFLFCLVPGIYLSVAWYFSMLLVADRDMDFWPAMELSRKMVSKHWFAVFGLLLVAGLVAFSGIVLCCIGVFATMPIMLAAVAYTYEDIFGRKTS